MNAMTRIATAPEGQRVTLTQAEYDRAKGLVARGCNRLADLGINSGAELPWSNPDVLQGTEGFPLEVEREGGAISFATVALTSPTEELIEFLSDPPASYSRHHISFGNYYVCYWLELQKRVHLFEQDRRPAERRARLAFVVGILGLLIAAITLALKFFARGN